MQKNSLLVVFLLTLGTFYSMAQTTVTQSVVHSSDDAWEQNNGDMNITQDDVQLGKEGYAAFRFQYAAIPAGATITSAHIEFKSKDDRADIPSGVIIKGELNPYSITILNSPFNISSRNMTSDSVSWTFGNWVKNEVYSSPNLANLIQEIVNQGFWTAGNPLVLILDATGSKERKTYSFDNNPLFAPKLVVTYTGGNPPVDISDHVDADMDLSATNEIQDLELTANILSLSGDTTPVDLSAYLDNTDTQDLSIDGTGKIISLTDGGSVTINTDDADADATNEYNTNATMNGTDLEITDGGGTKTVDLSSLDQSGAVATAQNTADQAVNDAAQAQLTADNALAAAGQAQNDINNHIAVDLDTDATNEYNTSAVLNGTDLEIIDGGGTQTVDLSSLANMPETDPEFNASPAAGISNGDVSNWNEAHGWGDHSVAGYLTTENDPKVGSLTNNTIPRWDGTQLQDGIIKDNGSNIGIGALPDPAYLINAIGGDVKFEISDFGNFDIPTYAGVMKIYNKYNPTQYAILRGNSGGPTYRAELELASETGNLILRSPQANGTDLSKIEATGDLSILADNVGIGTTSPDAKLHVEGGSIKMVDGNQAAGRVLTSDADGLASWQDIVDNVDDADNDPSNEIQTLSLSGNDLTISGAGGNTITLPTTPETDPEVGANTTHRMPVWNGSALVAGSVYSQGNTVSVSGSAIGLHNTANGINATAIGYQNTANAEYSMALGSESVASGNGSTAIGLGAQATGNFSFAMGLGAQATGIAAITLGTDVHATGDYSLAMGRFSTAFGGSATAMGYYTQATGEASTTMGRQTDAWGTASTALGWFTGAGGHAALATGNNTRAYADNSTAMGNGTLSNGFATTSMGNQTQAIAYASTALGQFNVGAGNGGVWVNTDPIFEIGIGADNDNRSNAITVLKNGNMGIGTFTPDAKLHVAGGSFKLADGTQAAGSVLTSDADGLASWQALADNDPENEYNTSAVLNGTDLEITDGGGTKIVDLSSLANVAEVDPKVGTLSANKVPHWNGSALQDGLIEDDGNQVSITNDALVNGITIGRGSGFAVENTAIGESTLSSNTTGWGAVAVGKNALANNTWAYGNTAVGWESLKENTGIGNTALGMISLQQNTTGGENVAIGYASLFHNTTGAWNTALGANALQDNTTGDTNIAIGRNGLKSNTSGFGNVAVGISALEFGNGNGNIAIGGGSMRFNQTGWDNIAIGNNALFSNNTGYWNTTLGNGSLYSNESGVGNVAMGRGSLYYNTLGGYNAVLGYGSMYFNTEGGDNAALGTESLYSNTTGNNNTALGKSALYLNTTGSNNTAIGVAATVASGDLHNATAVGASAVVETSNSLVLGANNVNVGIGTSSPNQKLHIAGGTIRIENITENNAACRALYVDNNGVVFYKDECAIPFSNNDSDLLLNEIKKRDEKISELEDMLTKLSKQVSMLIDERSLQSEVLNTPEKAWIEQNMPNPFLNETRIAYYIPANSQQAQIIFYDINGSVMKVTDIKETGKGILTVASGTLSAGTYFYKLVVDNQDIDTKKAVFIN